MLQAIRAAQLARDQPTLDTINIRLYREHSASERYRTALPRILGQEEAGGPFTYQDIGTVTSPISDINR